MGDLSSELARGRDSPRQRTAIVFEELAALLKREAVRNVQDRADTLLWR